MRRRNERRTRTRTKRRKKTKKALFVTRCFEAVLTSIPDIHERIAHSSSRKGIDRLISDKQWRSP